MKEHGGGINVRALAVLIAVVYYITKTIVVGSLLDPGSGVVIRALDFVPLLTWAWVSSDSRIIGVEWMAILMSLVDAIVLVALIVVWRRIITESTQIGLERHNVDYSSNLC